MTPALESFAGPELHRAMYGPLASYFQLVNCGSPPRNQMMPRRVGIIYEQQCSSAAYMGQSVWARV